MGRRSERLAESEDVLAITAPVDLLREISIVDTPGTNAILREHEAMTTRFVPRSDLVLFVTSADRPFTESERAFLESIRDWGKKVVMVINKIDLFQGEDELAQVQRLYRRERPQPVRDHPGDLPGQRPPGAARQAGRAGAVGCQPLRGRGKLHPGDSG